MRNKKLIIISLAIISINLIYNIFTTYQSESRLTKHVMKDAKSDIYSARMYIDEAITKLEASKETQSLKFEDVERMIWVNREIHYYVGRLLDKAKALKSEDYIKTKVQLSSHSIMSRGSSVDSPVSSQDIEHFYRAFLNGLTDREEELKLEENDIKVLQMIINSYNGYNFALSEISRKISENKKNWTEELNKIYTLNVLMQDY